MNQKVALGFSQQKGSDLPPNPVLNPPHVFPVPTAQSLSFSLGPSDPSAQALLTSPGSAARSFWLDLHPATWAPIPPTSEPLHRLFPLPGNCLQNSSPMHHPALVWAFKAFGDLPGRQARLPALHRVVPSTSPSEQLISVQNSNSAAL